jgi:hypothetical protein
MPLARQLPVALARSLILPSLAPLLPHDHLLTHSVHHGYGYHRGFGAAGSAGAGTVPNPVPSATPYPSAWVSVIPMGIASAETVGLMSHQSEGTCSYVYFLSRHTTHSQPLHPSSVPHARHCTHEHYITSTQAFVM